MQVLQENGEIIKALRKIPKLQAFDKKDLRKILSCSQILKYKPGEAIAREEESDHRIYFIVSGKVRVTRNGVEMKQLCRTGDVFGEMRLLSVSRPDVLRRGRRRDGLPGHGRPPPWKNSGKRPV